MNMRNSNENESRSEPFSYATKRLRLSHLVVGFFERKATNDRGLRLGRRGGDAIPLNRGAPGLGALLKLVLRVLMRKTPDSGRGSDSPLESGRVKAPESGRGQPSQDE